MALFEGYKRQEGTRSKTHLIKSGHMSPAGEWLVDTRFVTDKSLSPVFRDGVLFTYQYGGPGMEEVVIPQGRIVGVSTPVKDFVTKKFKTVLTLPGLALNGNTVGVVPYNITKDYLQLDRFGGNQPSFVTLDLLTLPYMPAIAPAATLDKAGLLDEEQRISHDEKMPWGAVIGKVEVGDYLKATASGRFTKWVKGTDDACDIVGQAIDCDLNQEPWGWTKWMLWDMADIKEDDVFINRSGASNLPSDGGWPYDPDFKDGTNIYQHVHQQGLTDPTGIPGLHDGSGNYIGYGKNDTEYTDIELGTVDAGVSGPKLITVNALDFTGNNLVNLREGVVVKLDGVQVDADKLSIDYKNGKITISVDAVDANKKITATYKAFHYGSTSYLDFKGVHGAMYVLLKK